eukprot:TRINITY_DN4101_c0_g1_i1.p1 TRINITY_DN4101_c0_g1~~TRINITY_DN4101_c0_g1_i1.p1  ORF type:complete len:114 (-),score=21.20 TRINITY_DN4101_c0_g1_i1:102-419(-)
MSEDVIAGYNKLRSDHSQLLERHRSVQAEIEEHRLVLLALAELPPQRKCYRSVGGTLVERSVSEVRPAVERSSAQLQQTSAAISQTLPLAEEALHEYAKLRGIKW